jgi:hypothetical protein
MKRAIAWRGFAAAVGLSSFFLAAESVSAAELKAETLAAWDLAVVAAEASMKARLDPGKVFLWADEEPERVERLRRGEIPVAPMSRHGLIPVPGGLIHQWMGAIFIPHATLPEVVGVILDYDRYAEFYKPFVVDARLLARSGDEYRFSMRWVHKVLAITGAMDAQYASTISYLDDRRCYTVSSTTRVQEIRNYGQPSESVLPPDQGNGFLWRLYSVTRYEQRDGGVYVESEAMALTRDIPAYLRWLVRPLAARLSRNAVLIALTQTRDAVRAVGEKAGRLGNQPELAPLAAPAGH